MSDSPRISRVITRTGDDGKTGLADGSRVAKDHPLMEAMGTLDELNAHIGVLRSLALPHEVDSLLIPIQHRLFDLGGSLAGGQPAPFDEATVALESATQTLNAALPPLTEFVLPGGSPPSAQAHVVRTVVRRAERALVTALRSADTPEIPGGLPYLNRLSDFFFVLARHLNNEGETIWERP